MSKLALALATLGSLAVFSSNVQADPYYRGRTYSGVRTVGGNYYTPGLGYNLSRTSYYSRRYNNPHYGYTPTYGVPRFNLYQSSGVSGLYYGGVRSYSPSYSRYGRSRSGFGVGVTNRGVTLYYRR